MLWTFRPRLWDGPGVGATAGGPGGVSLCGDVSGVVGWEDGPPANRARRLRRICTKEIKHKCTNSFAWAHTCTPHCLPPLHLPHGMDIYSWNTANRAALPDNL